MLSPPRRWAGHVSPPAAARSRRRMLAERPIPMSEAPRVAPESLGSGRVEQAGEGLLARLPLATGRPIADDTWRFEQKSGGTVAS